MPAAPASPISLRLRPPALLLLLFAPTSCAHSSNGLRRHGSKSCGPCSAFVSVSRRPVTVFFCFHLPLVFLLSSSALQCLQLAWSTSSPSIGLRDVPHACQNGTPKERASGSQGSHPHISTRPTFYCSHPHLLFRAPSSGAGVGDMLRRAIGGLSVPALSVSSSTLLGLSRLRALALVPRVTSVRCHMLQVSSM